MLEKEKAEFYAKELRSYLGEMTEDSACEVIVVEDATAIVVVPADTNTTGTFFHCEEIVDFCRGHHLSFWVGAKSVAGVLPYAYVYIF